MSNFNDRVKFVVLALFPMCFYLVGFFGIESKASLGQKGLLDVI